MIVLNGVWYVRVPNYLDDSGLLARMSRDELNVYMALCRHERRWFVRVTALELARGLGWSGDRKARGVLARLVKMGAIRQGRSGFRILRKAE